MILRDGAVRASSPFGDDPSRLTEEANGKSIGMLALSKGGFGIFREMTRKNLPIPASPPLTRAALR